MVDTKITSCDANNYIRVVIADHQAVVRVGLRILLEAQPNLQIVGEAGRAVEALHLIETLTPDVLVLEVRLPDLSGPALLREIAAHEQSTSVLLFSTYDPSLIPHLRQSQIYGYLTKDTEPEKIIEAIRGIGNGEAGWFVPRVAACFCQQAQGMDILSQREQEVLQLIVQEYTNAEIATRLYVSERTVKNHVAHILAKLGVKTRTGAAVWGCLQGITPSTTTSDVRR